MRGNAPSRNVCKYTEQCVQAARELLLHKRAAEELSSGCDGWEIKIKKKTAIPGSSTLISSHPPPPSSARTSRLVHNFWSPFNFSPSGKPPGLRGRATFNAWCPRGRSERLCASTLRFPEILLERRKHHIGAHLLWEASVRTLPRRWDPNRQLLATARCAAGSRRHRHPWVLPPKQPVTTSLRPRSSLRESPQQLFFFFFSPTSRSSAMDLTGSKWNYTCISLFVTFTSTRTPPTKPAAVRV